MRSTLLVILLLVAPRGAFALTWDFDEGITWGWTARESGGYSDRISREPLQSEVVDGVWRIAPVPGRRPTVQLRSPLIGKDSALFDGLTLRLRLVHHSPTEGTFVMRWSNAKKRNLSVRGFIAGRDDQFYPIEWEEVTLNLRILAADPERAITWQDTLFNFQLDLVLYQDPQDVDNHPKFLEIDWIELTGSEELAQGELLPEDIGVEVGSPGTLFADPDFFPLGEGIGTIKGWRSHLRKSHGAVGDVDGDGDADIVVAWDRPLDRGRDLGWTVASNDGLGGFEPTQEFPFATTFNPPSLGLRGSDFDGDGLLDLVVANDSAVELWYNWGDGFDPTLQLANVEFTGLADVDSDGDADLLISDTSFQEVSLWINDGYDFVPSDTLALDSKVVIPDLTGGQPLGEAASLLWNGSCDEPPDVWQLTRPWAASEEPPLSFEAAINPCDLHLLADLDGNGMVDLLGSPKRLTMSYGRDYHGLALWRLDASGVLARDSLLDWKAFIAHRATASDLNGDGVLDMAVVVGNSTVGRPALVVWLGQRDGVPVLEGYYPLPGEGNQVLTGDVNGDGDIDLVVLGMNPASGLGGVFVLINQGTPATAVASETAATPTAFALGANYPNPFNPATTIPLAVPDGAKNVDLTIYNVLGQPMRQVWTGPLAAGEHRLTWDGRDAQGRPVAAGVYVYRMQVGEQTHTRKMVKLD